MEPVVLTAKRITLRLPPSPILDALAVLQPVVDEARRQWNRALVTETERLDAMFMADGVTEPLSQEQRIMRGSIYDKQWVGQSPKSAACFQPDGGPVKCAAPEPPTLTRSAGHIASNLTQSHDWVDRIELALFAEAGVEVGCCPPVAPGLEPMLSDAVGRAAHLAVRLERIAVRIAGPVANEGRESD